MRIANRDRLWVAGGLVVALILTAIVWQFLITGQNDTTNSVKADIDSAQQQVTDSRRTLNQLKADNVNLDKYKAQLAANQLALPSDTAIPALLLEFQAAGDATAVGIAQIQIGTPAAVVGSTVLYAVTISVTASGPADNLAAFLKQLQAIQPRALLIASAGFAPGAGTNQQQLNLSLRVFVAPADGKVPATS